MHYNNMYYNKQNLKLLYSMTENLQKIIKETDGRNAYVYNQARITQINTSKLIYWFNYLRANKIADKLRSKVNEQLVNLKSQVNDEISGTIDIYEVAKTYTYYVNRLIKIDYAIDYYFDRYNEE